MDDRQILALAEKGIAEYLLAERDRGRITGTYYSEAAARTFSNFSKWFTAAELDRISPNLRDALRDAVAGGRQRPRGNRHVQVFHDLA